MIRWGCMRALDGTVDRDEQVAAINGCICALRVIRDKTGRIERVLVSCSSRVGDFGESFDTVKEAKKMG